MRNPIRYLFDRTEGPRNYFLARWLFLRALGLIYFSAFFALLFQARGLIGTHGIFPISDYFTRLQAAVPGLARFWYAPSILWISPTNHFLMALCWTGLIASLLVTFNLWPRATLTICFVCFLSFTAAAQDFSNYQSDSMLLAAGFLALFLSPRGLRPGLATNDPPPRAAWFLLLYEWFRIYLESGIVKLTSGDPTWRNLTAMYEYYQNGPLPTWIGWYLQHLPHWFHIATAGLTLLMELVLIWMAVLPRRFRIACFVLVTAWQIGVIATANYAFLNYLVLILAVLLLDDKLLTRFIPHRLRRYFTIATPPETLSSRPEAAHFAAAVERPPYSVNSPPQPDATPRKHLQALTTAFTAVLLTWIAYVTTAELILLLASTAPLPQTPITALEPFRIANQYGLFAVMTPHRYEIEFQGSNDGTHWTPYPFRYKPQDPHTAPGIYAPYQPRFDWNLWFASLGPWLQNPMVPRTEELLLTNDPDVLALFASNPFPNAPPKYVRAVLWQYWFSTWQQKRTQHIWWRRQYLGTYAPTLTLQPDGHFTVTEAPTLDGPPQP
jgi:hypothetical protein